MWEMQNQVNRLLAKAFMTAQEVAEKIDCPELSVTPSELSRALRASSLTPKQRKILEAAHAVLTERLERINKQTEAAIKRAEKALEKSESLDSMRG